MQSMSGRCRRVGVFVTVLALLVVVSPVAAQRPETGVTLAGEVIAGMAISLVVGGGLILFGPSYTDRTTRRVLDNPGGAFVYGLGIAIVLVIALVILILSVVGILVAIPLVIAVIIVGELGYLALGRTVTDSWGVTLLIAIGASAVVVGVPYLGGLLGFVLSTLGIGAAFLEYRDDGSSGSGGSLGRHTSATDRARPHR